MLGILSQAGPVLNSSGLGVLGAAVGAGIVVWGAAKGIGHLAGQAMEGIARQPEAGGRIGVNIIIAAALDRYSEYLRNKRLAGAKHL